MRTTVAGFEWDEGNWPKCGKHVVSKSEFKHVLRSAPLVLPDRYPQHVDTRFDAVGKNSDGRYIFVVFTLREREGKTSATREIARMDDPLQSRERIWTRFASGSLFMPSMI